MNVLYGKRACILIEVPDPCDAEFLGRWLLAAAAADRAIQKQFKRNRSLRKRIERLEVIYMVEFSPAAIQFVELMLKNDRSFSLDIWGEWSEIFVVMAEIGFFHQTRYRYQVTIPKKIVGSNIQDALLKLAATEDKKYFLHPERLVSFLSES